MEYFLSNVHGDFLILIVFQAQTLMLVKDMLLHHFGVMPIYVKRELFDTLLLLTILMLLLLQYLMK